MFGKRLKLFKLFGFEVGIDMSWIILAILVAWSLSVGFFPFKYKNLSTGTYWLMGIVGAVGLFLSIILHEFCHSLVARRAGMQMKGITLFIFGGVAQMGDEPPSALSEFFIAIAGPIASLLIGGAFLGLYAAGESIGWPSPLNGVLSYLAMINALLAGFNLLPAYPLDGGRVLRSILWKVKGDLRWATRIASRIGVGFGLLLIFLGLFRILAGNLVGGMWFFLIGIFIQSAANMSYQQLLVRKALQGEPLKRFMSDTPVTATPDMTIRQLVDDYIYRHHYKLFPVVRNGNHLLGCVTTRQVKEVPREEWSQKTVGEVTEACSSSNTIEPGADAVDALSRMRRNQTSRMMVVENGRLKGVVALKDMLEFLALKVELDV